MVGREAARFARAKRLSALADWNEVVAFALGLDGAELSTSYGKPTVKVAANGRAFVAAGHEPDSSFVVLIDRDTVEMLLTTDPATFWQSPHYVGWPAVLVRLR